MNQEKFKIVSFLNREYKGSKLQILFMSCAGTMSMASILPIISVAAETAASGSMNAEFRLFAMYIVVCIAIVICKYYSLTRITMIAEESVHNVRLRLIDKLCHSELKFIESAEKGEIFARIAHDTDFISQGATDVINAFEVLLTFFFIFFYIAFISLSGFVFILLFISVLTGAFLLNYQKIREHLSISGKKEAEFFDALNDVLSGFKEIRINSKKNNALFADIEAIAEKTKYLKTDAGLKSNRNILLALILYSGVLAVTIFVMPIFVKTQSDVVTKLVASLIFMFSMIGSLFRGIPLFFQLNVIVENIERLEAALDSAEIRNVEQKSLPGDFKEIRLKSLNFEYMGKDGDVLFRVGPIDLSIRKGELLFIVGGNGSGKSTLLKLLTGLYYPMANDGCIMLDNTKITQENYQSYRELFSIIFTDFHLFKKLYGLESIDEQSVKNMLKEMDIHTKTDYVNGSFTNLDLSTGQKKRIAYIASILEDKSIYIFDEWAADQDPAFRKHFYRQLLKDLKAMGKTVIAVTHDDRYFDKADRVVKMEEGKLTRL